MTKFIFTQSICIGSYIAINLPSFIGYYINVPVLCTNFIYVLPNYSFIIPKSIVSENELINSTEYITIQFETDRFDIDEICIATINGNMKVIIKIIIIIRRRISDRRPCVQDTGGRSPSGARASSPPTDNHPDL